jgi:hypothetical protein
MVGNIVGDALTTTEQIVPPTNVKKQNYARLRSSRTGVILTLVGLHLECCSVFRLADPTPLNNLDSFSQSPGCSEILQDQFAVFGSSVSY